MNIVLDEIQRVRNILIPYWSKIGYEKCVALRAAGKLPVEVKDAWREYCMLIPFGTSCDIHRIATILVPYWSKVGYENYVSLRKEGKLPVEVERAWEAWQDFISKHSRDDIKSILDTIAA